jgi:hypothetical protein
MQCVAARSEYSSAILLRQRIDLCAALQSSELNRASGSKTAKRQDLWDTNPLFRGQCSVDISGESVWKLIT